MTSENQAEALAALAEVWSLSPDVRLGQLLCHLGFLGEAHLGRGLGYIEDDELMSVLHRHREELLARSGVAPPLAPQRTPVTGGAFSPADARGPVAGSVEQGR